MKVYALFYGFYSDRQLFGIFDTLESAQAQHDAHPDPDEPGHVHEADWQLDAGEDWETNPAERRWLCQHKLYTTWGDCGFGIEERELQTAQVAEHVA